MKSILPTNPSSGRDDMVDLNVNVREAKSTGSFSVGAGYSTSNGAIANARLTENNILGTGRRVDLNADVGTQQTNLNLSLSDRKIADTDVSGSVEAFRASRVFLDFDRVLTGGAVSLGYPLESIFGETFEDFNTKSSFGRRKTRISIASKPMPQRSLRIPPAA